MQVSGGFRFADKVPLESRKQGRPSETVPKAEISHQSHRGVWKGLAKAVCPIYLQKPGFLRIDQKFVESYEKSSEYTHERRTQKAKQFSIKRKVGRLRFQHLQSQRTVPKEEWREGRRGGLLRQQQQTVHWRPVTKSAPDLPETSLTSLQSLAKGKPNSSRAREGDSCSVPGERNRETEVVEHWSNEGVGVGEEKQRHC